MKHFKQLVKELPSKKVVMAFGRWQPPTIGHSLLVTAVKHIASKQGADHVIYASRSQDKKSNPLPAERKVYYLKRMFPKTNFVGANEHVRTFMEAAKELNKKYKNLVMVAGSDRVPEYKKLLDKYNGKEFHYDTIEVVSAGERDPDSEGASGMSGTKMRDAAKKGDFDSFKRGLPSTLTTVDAKRLMNEIREGMGISAVKEEISFETNDLRESYHRGEIFQVGEKVEDDSGIYEIVDRGTNYLTVVNESGNVSKKWIHTVKSFKQIYEDIPIGPAPKEITYKGYTTKNLHHSADAAKAFQTTIERMGKGLTDTNDPVALLNALKHTDEYMKLNDLHLEKGQPLDDKELASWKHSHAKAKESLERIGEFMHHMDYWHMHGHELEGLEAKYYPGTAGGEFADSYTPEGNLLEMKYTGTDKIKVARVIANALGLDDVEKSSNPEMLINNALRKVRNKPMRPEYVDVLHKMLQTAQEAGIAYDEKLVPQKAQKVEEGVKQPNGTDKVGGIIAELSPETLKSYIPKAMGNKSAADFQRGVKMAQGSGGEEELRKKSDKRSTGIHTAIKKLTKEEVELEEGKMGELHDTISRHLDKHISDFKSGHTGMDQFGSKVLSAHKSVAKEHGLEHKHAAKMVNDYVDSKLNEDVWKGVDKAYPKLANRDAILGAHQLAAKLKADKEKKQQEYHDGKKVNEEISDLLEQIATAAIMNRDTTELKKKLSAVRHDFKNNESDQEAEQQNKPQHTKAGHSMTAPHESDTVRKMKVRYQTEEVELDEDQATAEYKVKTYYDNNKGKTVTRKIRPHRVTFAGSKKNAEPEVDEPGEDLKNEAFAGTIIPGTDISAKNKVKEGIVGIPAGDMGAMPVGAPDAYSGNPSIITKDVKDKLRDKNALKLKEEHEDEDEVSDDELDDMADSVTDLEHVIDAYDDDELHIVDDNGDHVDDLKEEVINEVLSRAERIKAKVRFAQTKSKRERKIQIALRTPSSVKKLNSRARKLAVKLMKQRIARKPLESLSVSEKERVEATVAKRKKAIDRLAMKLVPRVKKIEQTRLHHKK